MNVKYNKLVRDKIPEIITRKGNVAKIRTTSSAEYKEKLREKLKEEVLEFLKDENVDELTDILEIVYALSEENGISKDELEMIRKKKAGERGAFREKSILEEVDE